LTVGERAFLQRPEASDAIVRLAEHALAELSDRDEQQGGPHERDEQFRGDLGRKATDGADERTVASAQRPPALGDGRAPSSCTYVGQGTQGASVVDPATKLVINQRPSIRATSRSATVASANFSLS
jgi:hypothetical protein